jgi:hypothetical protein
MPPCLDGGGDGPSATLADDMALGEVMVKYLVAYVMDDCRSDLDPSSPVSWSKNLRVVLENIASSAFVRLPTGRQWIS